VAGTPAVGTSPPYRARATLEASPAADQHDAIARLPGWAVGPCQYHGDGQRWHVSAIDLRPRGRHACREAITATGATEIAALRALTALLGARSR
jgi:hypothetical protein